MAKGLGQGMVKNSKGERMGIEYRKIVTVSDIARVLLADGTPTAKVAFLTGMPEIEIKRLIKVNSVNIG